MAFRNYINNTMICEELVESVEGEDLEVLFEELYIMEAELNEIAGLGKLASFLKKANDKGDEAAAKAKEKGKEVLDTAKYAAKNMAKEAKDKIVGDAKAIGQAHKEIAVAAKDKAVQVVTKAQDAFKDIWGKAMKTELTPDQKATVEELKGIFAKMASGKYLNREDSVKVLAAVLAGGSTEGFPSIKAYNKQLERLRTTPGINSVQISVKINKK
jgi:hypothetical protein